MTRTIICFLLVLSAYSGHALAAWHSVLTHAHSSDCDDGRMTLAQIKELAVQKGYDATIITPHTDCFVEKWAKNHRSAKALKVMPWPHSHGWPNEYDSCKTKIEDLNDSTFVAIAGREEPVDLTPSQTMCHIGLYTPLNTPILRDEWAKPHDIQNVLKRRRKTGDEIAVIHHPHLCPAWHDYAASFDCVEMLNDFHALGPQRERNYHTALSLLVANMGNDRPLCAIGGQDFHHSSQWHDGIISTFVATDNLNQESLLAGIRQGNTIATRGIIIEEMTIPSRETQVITDGKAMITGRIRFWRNHFTTSTAILMFRDGKKFKRIPLQEISSTLRTRTFTFSFTDEYLQPGEKASYIVTIPHWLVSSPYILKKEDAAPDQNNHNASRTPTSTTRVAWPLADYPHDADQHIDSVWSAQSTKLQAHGSVIICGKPNTFLTLPDRMTLTTCTQPSLYIGYNYATNTRETVNFASGVLGCFNCDQPGIYFRSSSFARPLDFIDYACIRSGYRDQGVDCLLVSTKAAEVGMRFGVCNPKGSFTVDQYGHITACDVVNHAVVIAPRPSGAWSLSFEDHFDDPLIDEWYWLIRP